MRSLYHIFCVSLQKITNNNKYMANYNIRELQVRILGILLEFDKVCKEHGLRYCICGGTMIGAVRHKGFIPWDDDLDVSMPRPDYEKLIAHCHEWLPKQFEFVCAENDPNYPLPFGKIQDASTAQAPLLPWRMLYRHIPIRRIPRQCFGTALAMHKIPLSETMPVSCPS